MVLLAGALGLLMPDTLRGGKEAVPYLLGVVMFCMGLTMTGQDFRGVVRRPWAVGLGLVAHYVIMPGLGWLIANALGLSPQLAAGLILVGCAPSGTASNVVAYLARGDVALAVSIGTVSTLLLGYLAGRAGRLGERGSRALTFEVGMQNSGLAAALATAHFSPLAALPAAIFSVWHNVTGALVAAWFSRRPAGD
ncbi:bile acid:sodium symporter family protein [Actinomadura oligospora]|uniref:bile acid:sodium symporter family protein n=1 Tax=Actinomadura oligospora TaxID=111804 RepID=UPI00047BCCCB|nr:bile acid:sodium symporter family protein [Actinomadura oligospora]